jgi:hypothetical protein
VHTHDLVEVLTLLDVPPPEGFPVLEGDLGELGVTVDCGVSIEFRAVVWVNGTE